MCSVIIETEHKQCNNDKGLKRPQDNVELLDSEGMEPPTRKRKLDLNETGTLNKTKEVTTVRFQEQPEPKQVSNTAPDEKPQRRLTCDEIINSLSKALPKIVRTQYIYKENESCDDGTSSQYFNDNDDYLEKPLGTVLTEYDNPIIKTQKRSYKDSPNKSEVLDHFVLTLADGKDPSIANYHKEIQKLSLWFIETADGVDLQSNEGGGFWKVLYLFRRHSFTNQQQQQQSPNAESSTSKQTEQSETSKFSLVGYMTLFHFYAPFKRPKPGIVLRVCQALLLPPYQRCGHGKIMLHAVHDLASEKYINVLLSPGEIVEINVEDPAPGFVRLRDRVDYELFRNFTLTDDAAIDRKFVEKPLEEQDFSMSIMPDSIALEIASRLRMTSSKRIHIAYEIYKLDQVNQLLCQMNTEEQQQLEDQSINKKTKELLEKAYRLMVKKRLVKVYGDELSQLQTKNERQERLAELFEERRNYYGKLLG